MSRKSNQQAKAFKFWFPYWNNPIPTPSPERTQPQRSPTQTRSSASQQPTASSSPASSTQRSQPSVSPSPSRKSSLPTKTNDPIRRQQPPKSNTPVKPSSPSRFQSKVREQPAEKAALLRQPDSFKEKNPKRDEQKNLDETKAAENPGLKMGKSDSEHRQNVGERSEEGITAETNESDSESKVDIGTTVKRNKVEEEETRLAYPEPFRQDLGDSDQQKTIRKPEESPGLAAKKSNLEPKEDIGGASVQQMPKETHEENPQTEERQPNLEPQQQIEASNQPKIYEKLEVVNGMKTMQTDSTPKQKIEPSNEQKQHEITENIHKENTNQLPYPIVNQESQGFINQKETTDTSIPDIEPERGVHTTQAAKHGRKQESFDGGKTQTNTEIFGNQRPSTSEKILDNRAERDYMITGVEADEPHPKNGGPMHAAREEPVDKENKSAKVKKENESSEKVSKVSISTGPWVAFADGERAGFQKEIKEGLSKLVDKLSIGRSDNLRTDRGVSIITLAGKNKGAIMKIGKDSAKGSKKPEDEQKHNNEEMVEMAASVNSNVQSINNSLLNESKCKARNPGVHLVLSAEPKDLKKKTETHGSQKSALSTPTPRKLLCYEPPSVRRRCLRGLMMEPSEDDEDGAQKRRRHGCRVDVGCGEKGKGEKGIDETTSIPN